MTRTVIAFDNEALSRAVGDILEKNSIPVRVFCKSGAEAIRAIHKMGGGLIICGQKLPDMTSDSLAYDVHDIATLLVVAKPTALELCENVDVFKLPLPLKAGELIGAVNMLLQIDSMRSAKTLPRRSEDEVQLITRAKELLMQKSGINEAMAHRYIQRKSMEAGAKMTDTAKLILASFE